MAFLDADGQANGSDSLNKYHSQHSSVDFFTNHIQSFEDQQILCFASSQSLFAVEKVSSDIYKNIKHLEENGYDFLIVDTSPSISDLSVSCLSISDGVFIPIKMNKLDFKGVRKTLSTIKMVRDVNNSKVTLLGIIPNMLIGMSKKQKISLGNLIQQNPGKILPYLSNRDPFNEAMNTSTPIWDAKPMTGNIKVAADEMKRLMEDIISRILAHETNEGT